MWLQECMSSKCVAQHGSRDRNKDGRCKAGTKVGVVLITSAYCTISGTCTCILPCLYQIVVIKFDSSTSSLQNPHNKVVCKKQKQGNPWYSDGHSSARKIKSRWLRSWLRKTRCPDATIRCSISVWKHSQRRLDWTQCKSRPSIHLP